MKNYGWSKFTVTSCAVLNIVTAANAGTEAGTEVDSQANWSVSSVVGDQINTEYHDTWSTVSEDDLTLHFGSNRPGGFVKSNVEDGWAVTSEGIPTKYDIYVSTRNSADQPWGKPKLLPATINSEHNDHSAFVSEDRHYLVFASNRPGGCGDMDLYVSYREDVNDNQAWGAAKNLGCIEQGGPNGAGLESCPILHFDKAANNMKIYYVGSPSPNPAGMDFKYSVFDSQTMTAKGDKDLNVRNYNKDSLDAHFDPKFGYSWSNHPGGQGGSDLWVSSQIDGSGVDWTQPVNLGPSINTEYEEQMPSPAGHNGDKIYFLSDRPNGKGGMDIYTATKVK